MDFAVPTDDRAKIQENNKRDKYLNLTKMLWNMRVTAIPIVIGVLGTVSKGFVKELEELVIGRQIENIQTTALLRLAGILGRVLET